jgi:enoyl-CoA hydratase/carnithine racemase
MTSLTARVAVSAQRYSKPTTADADYKLQQDLARPIIYHLRVATCSQPEVKGLTMMTNSQYNGWRFAKMSARQMSPEETRMAEESTASLVEYACKDQVATLTLNRPQRLNAFNDELVRHLADALRRFDLDPEAQVAVICGNGRAFSSGADVHQRQLRKREEFLEHGGPQGWGANSGDLLTRSVNWKPVIAAPHGYAMGLALGIVLECDLIVAAAGTKFQVTETSRGLGGAKYWALLNFRGAAAFATEVTLTGRFFTAEEALAAGIINRVAPEGRHLEVAYELAAEVAKNPPLSVRATVRTRRWYMDQLEREVTMQTAPLKLYLSEDFQEAARAFAEKRKPGPFKGR